MADPNYINSALQLATGINRGGTQGAQAALQGAAGLSHALPSAPELQGVTNTLGGAGNALGILNGVEQGGVGGYGSSALNATALAGRSGLFDPATNQTLNSTAGGLNNALGIYRGIQQGGVGGYGGAAVNAAQLGSRAGAFGGAGGAIGQAAGYAAIPLSLYNEINNWESGNTGSDALGGAATGAAIGSVVPGVGTLIGGLVGGAAGALSSAFGPGKEAIETKNYKKYEDIYKQHPEVASQVQNPFVNLAGVFDQRNSSLPFYQAYGRMGEDAFTKELMTHINSEVQQGTISKDSTAPEIMNKVVNPWIGSMGQGWSKDPASFSEQASSDALIQQMVDQYIHGQQGNWKSRGGDYRFGDLKPFGAAEGGSVRHYDSGGPIDTGISDDMITISGDRPGGGPDPSGEPYVDPTYGQWDNYWDASLQDLNFNPNSINTLPSVNNALNPSLATRAGNALKDPRLLGALLGGGLGLAASGGGGGSQAFSFHPPAPFQDVPHSYGNFSAQPRTQTQPNIDYAHAAEHGPEAQFYTPSPQQVNPWTPPSSPLQQAAPQMQPMPVQASPAPEINRPQIQQAAPAPAVNQFLAQLQAQQQAAAPPPAPISSPQAMARNAAIAQGGFAGLGAMTRGPSAHSQFRADGGSIGHSPLLLGHLLSKGSHVQGQGDGTSDDIPAMLSEGEYVIPAHIVSALGNGSNNAGAKALDALQERVRSRVGSQMAAGKHPARIAKPESFLKAA